MAKTTAEKIKSIETEMQQLDNQRKQLMQKQKEQDRKDRTKRLCRRMELFESLLPDTITLTDDLFKLFLEKTIITEYSRRILDGLTARNAAAAAPIRASAAAQSATQPTAKPAETEQDEDTIGSEDEGTAQG
jgi:predicted nuclease with TOPRIM domain